MATCVVDVDPSTGEEMNDRTEFIAHRQEWWADGALIDHIPEELAFRRGWSAAQKDLNRLAEKNGWKPWPGD